MYDNLPMILNSVNTLRQRFKFRKYNAGYENAKSSRGIKLHKSITNQVCKYLLRISFMSVMTTPFSSNPM